MWSHYLDSTDIIIYVVDSTKKNEIPEIKKTFEMLNKDIQGKEMLFICLLNKCELEGAIENDEFVKLAEIEDSLGCDFVLLRTSNVTNEGINILLKRVEGYFRSMSKFADE